MGKSHYNEVRVRACDRVVNMTTWERLFYRLSDLSMVGQLCARVCAHSELGSVA